MGLKMLAPLQGCYTNRILHRALPGAEGFSPLSGLVCLPLIRRDFTEKIFSDHFLPAVQLPAEDKSMVVHIFIFHRKKGNPESFLKGKNYQTLTGSSCCQLLLISN